MVQSHVDGTSCKLDNMVLRTFSEWPATMFQKEKNIENKTRERPVKNRKGMKPIIFLVKYEPQHLVTEVNPEAGSE